MFRQSFALLILVSLSTNLAADDVRYYQKDGVTFRETKQMVRRPVSRTEYVQKEQVRYEERLTTTVEETTRTVMVPVTEYRLEAYWKGRWNPLVQPHMAYRYVPRVRWEAREESVRLPVTRREVVPVTYTVRVPVTRREFVEEERISRVALLDTDGTAGRGAVRIGTAIPSIRDPRRRAIYVEPQPVFPRISRLIPPFLR